MKYYYFDSEITVESTTELMNFINQNEGDLRIYLRSSGGINSGRDALIDIFNSNKDRIELYAIGLIYSSGFTLFYSFKGKKIIMPCTIGMYHYSYTEYEINFNNKLIYRSDQFRQKENSKLILIIDNWCSSIGMTDKEIKKMKTNLGEVYFTNERLKELNNQK